MWFLSATSVQQMVQTWILPFSADHHLVAVEMISFGLSSTMSLHQTTLLMKFVFSGTNQTLTTPLGDWLVETDQEWLSEWDWFLLVDREFLYFRTLDTDWYWYIRRGRSHRAYLHQSTQLPAAPVAELVRATVTWDANAIILESCSRPRTFCTPPQNTVALAGRTLVGRTLVSPSIPWITDHLDSSPSIDILLQDILHRKAVAVCNCNRGSRLDTFIGCWMDWRRWHCARSYIRTKFV